MSSKSKLNLVTTSSKKGKSKKRNSKAKSHPQKQEVAGSNSPRSRKHHSQEPQTKSVARIPFSRDDSSSNWKALLKAQGKTIPVVKPVVPPISTGRSNEIKESAKQSKSSSYPTTSTPTEGVSVEKRPIRRQNSTKMSGIGASGGAGDASELDSLQSSLRVKQEFRAFGLPGSQQPQSTPKPKPPRSVSNSKGVTPRGFVKKVPIATGLNDIGYFDYTHYGALKTPITPAHSKYMEDTGVIAMDCEMVGVGMMKESALGRVSIVNEYGFCLYDTFVLPKMEITDYRTEFSGIREEDMRKAIPFNVAVSRVADLIKSHILIGHSLKSDMSVLFLGHPKSRTRDTALFFKKILHSKTPKLKTLSKKILNFQIQEGEHSSITDAQAAMALYQLYQPNWEEHVLQSNRGVDVFKLTLEEFYSKSASAPDTNAPNHHHHQPNFVKQGRYY